MSSDATNEGYGQTSVEKSQGWERMKSAFPVEPQLPEEPLAVPDPYESIPPVQRPGDPSAFATDRDISTRKLENRLNYTGHWKDAAALLNARRSGRK